MTLPSSTRSSRVVVASLSLLESKPKWIDDALGDVLGGDDDSKMDSEKQRLTEVLPLKTGLAGFCLDAQYGFVALLADAQYYVPVLVSSNDRPPQVTSPEALTLVQLAGGLDLGTAVLPPDALADLVVSSCDDLVDDDGSQMARVQELRRRISLETIKAIRNPKDTGSTETSLSRTSTQTTNTNNNAKRQEAIEASLDKVHTAVRGLPGLHETTKDQVLTALDQWADAKGNLDRNGFSELLRTIREQVMPKQIQSTVVFILTVNVISGEAIKRVDVETTNPLIAIGLALRYKKTIQVSIDPLDWEGVSPGIQAHNKIVHSFPAFRPVQELYEDAKIMDGFIPSMFERAQIDNDMKQ